MINILILIKKNYIIIIIEKNYYVIALKYYERYPKKNS
jgi:hypothetical protein